MGDSLLVTDVGIMTWPDGLQQPFIWLQLIRQMIHGRNNSTTRPTRFVITLYTTESRWISQELRMGGSLRSALKRVMYRKVETTHAVCVKRNTEAHARNHYCHGKARSVCLKSYPTCKVHAPYCHPWPVWLYPIFRHYLINGTIFWGKKVIEHKTHVFIFSTTFVRNFSHFKKDSARCCHKCTWVFM